jgi:Dolichyl-phosphate-mannose-protein mannosyltransferase
MIVAIVLAVLAGGGLAYAVLGRFLTRRLPSGPVPAAPPSPAVTPPEWAGLAAILALSLALGLHDIDRGLDYDELFTANYFVEVDSFAVTVSRYLVFNNHLAYSALAWLARGSLGRSEWALRLPALLLALAGLVCQWAFSRRSLGPAVGLLATLGLAASPFFTLYSHSARGYSGLLVCTLASSHFYLRLLRRPSRLDFLGFIAVAALGVYFHLYGALVVVAQAVFLTLLAVRSLYDPRSAPITLPAFRALWRALGVVPFVALALYYPVLFQLLDVVQKRGRGQFEPEFPITLLSSFAGSHNAAILLGALVLLVAGTVALYRRDRILTLYLLSLLAIPFLAVWLSRPLDLYPRFFVYWLPNFTLLCAAGLQGLWNWLASVSRPWTRLSLRAATLALAGGWVVAWAWASIQPTQEARFREAAGALEDGTSRATVCCAIGGDPGMLQWYCRHKLRVLQSCDEAEELVRDRVDVRCIYNRRSWEPPEQTRIAKFLERHCAAQQFGNLTVFTRRAE